jgi:aryl-alcohol dehydrogenase-like predicted oxidoreductase
METKQLGWTDMRITRIGFGAWALGGGNWIGGWGPQNDEESIATIHKALDLGINWIDTAATYGLGHSEEVVARALKGRANRPYVFTKCSTVWNEKREVSQNLDPQSLRRELEASLRRLQTDVIDLYQIHWPIPDEQIEEAWKTLAEFRQSGNVRYIGVANFSVQQMQRILPIAPIASEQPPYSLIKPQVEKDVLPFCQEHNIGVIVYSPMQSGLLTGTMTPERIRNLPKDDWRGRDVEFNEPRLSRNLKLVDLLREIGKPYGKTPGQVAIAWTLANPAVTGAIVGARRPDQVEQNVGAADLHLSKEDMEKIGEFVRNNP